MSLGLLHGSSLDISGPAWDSPGWGHLILLCLWSRSGIAGAHGLCPDTILHLSNGFEEQPHSRHEFSEQHYAALIHLLSYSLQGSLTTALARAEPPFPAPALSGRLQDAGSGWPCHMYPGP